jgi:hypothetical protein
MLRLATVGATKEESMMSLRGKLTVLLAASCVCVMSSASPLRAQNRQRDVITHDELLVAHSSLDLYQAIRGLRPHFLDAPLGARTRTVPTSFYVDGIRQNGVEALRSIPAATVERVAYLDPSKAESELGHRAAGGAVMVTLQGSRRLPASARDTTTPPPEH